MENLTDRRAWWVTVHKVTESDMTEATQHAHKVVPISEFKYISKIGMGKTCKLKDVSFQCMTKFTTN